MYVTICDDDAQARTQLVTLLQSQNWPVPVQFQQFDTLPQLTDCSQPMDVLFLDIEVGQENSLAWLSQHQPLANHPLVVLVSSHSCYVTGSYQVSVFQFLLKPFIPALLFKVFGDCCQQYRRHKQYCEVKTESGLERYLPLRHVVCVKSERHKVMYYDIQLQPHYGTERSLLEALQRLQTYGFCQVHKSYLVNLAFITKIDDAKTTLQVEGKTVTLPAGAKYIATARQQHLQYLAEKGTDEWNILR